MKTAAVLAVLLAAVPAAAQPVVEVVPTCVDAPAEQRAWLVRALERLDLLIVESGCQDTITLTEEVEGDRVVVRLSNAQAKRKMKVGPKDDRLAVYTAMAKSLLAPPEPEPAPTVAPTISPIEEYPSASTLHPELPQVDEVAAPELPMRSAIYMMLGAGTGTAFTLGYRTGRENKFDLAMQVIEESGDSGSKNSTFAMRIQMLRMSKPKATTSFYAGGGISFASTERQMSSSGSTVEAGGARLESTVGFELGRGKSHVFYAEAAGALPLYTVGDTYPATFVVSIGAGL